MTHGTGVVELRSGGLGAGIAPGLGGAVVWLRSHDGNGKVRDWMRPMPEEGGSVRDSACFPLVPFSNRIAGAGFDHQGNKVLLKPNWPGNMAIHGLGWERAWTVAHRAPDALSLRLSPEPDAWPWRAEFFLDYRLRPTGLTMRLRAENHDNEEMPSGLGFHPYFPRPAGTGLNLFCDAVLLTDAEILPVAVDGKHTVLQGLRNGRLPRQHFDNALTGWRGVAAITWADGGAIEVSTTPPTGFAILYAPENADFFCLEPVTHIPNAHHLRDGRLGPDGLVDLASGEVHTFEMSLDILAHDP